MVLLYFNSIKVRLERKLVNFCLSFLRFQFHKGTIRTDLIRVIKVQYRNFNSIKVRLEHSANGQRSSPHSNFNSIKVRLELPAPSNFDPVTAFQFHKGTIRTFNV